MTSYRLFVFIGIFFIFKSMGLSLTTSFVSADDEDITLKSVVVTLGKDNLNSIYAKPLSQYLASIIEKDHFLETSQLVTSALFDLDELRNQEKQTTTIITKNNVDGLIHLQITKGQMGLHLEIGLFTRKSGKIWAYANFLEKDKFDIDHLQIVVNNLYQQILNQIPYQGIILSRIGNKVTLNRGADSGLKIDQDINIIQIVGVTRHPQFKFVTQVQKEILGKIRITKMDDTLSFGYILFEKESQVVQQGLKLLLHEPLFYQNLITSKNEGVVEHLLSRGDGNVIMQGDSNEWIPESLPSFGRIQILFGMGEFGASTNLIKSGGQQGSTLFALNAEVDAELWVTKTWFLQTSINQGSAQIKNPLSGSTPNKLNFSMQDLKISAGYDFEISPRLYGPRIKALLGFAQFNSAVTDSSPTSFTSTTFNGLCLGLSGFMPIDETYSKWSYGADFWYHLLPSVNESPLTSGSPKNSQIIELSGMGYYHLKPNIYLLGKLTLETFSTQFSGTGTRTESVTSSDISWTRLNGGIEYLF